MYLSNYKNHNILIWAFSYETQQNRTIPWTLFLSRAVLVTHSFGHTPVLRAAFYGQNAVLQPYDLPVTRGGEGRNGWACAAQSNGVTHALNDPL